MGLFKTRWGLRVESRGRAPRAAETVGHPRASVRYRNVILGGVIAGIGGAWFTIGNVGEFSADMTAGLGYVALAAMIFGRWRPFGALGAALLFGFSVSLQSFLAVLNVGIPSPFLSMAPYVITIAVVCRARRPGAPAGGGRRPLQPGVSRASCPPSAQDQRRARPPPGRRRLGQPAMLARARRH